jgi:predicted molibdopterin-dependent oxidoreductase YjgC
LARVADTLKKAGSHTALIAGGETTNEEGFLAQRLLREALGSNDLDSRIAPLDAEQAKILARPDLAATVPDVEWADAVLVVETELVDEMPILELRVRKGRRRNGVKVAVASSHPSALDRDAAATVRFAPGSGEALLAALVAALGSKLAPDSTSEGPVPDGLGAEAEPPPDPAEHPHGDPVGAIDEVGTAPDPGAPAPVSGPGGQPGAMAGGPPGEQSEEGERPAAGVDTSSGEGYAGGESASESGAASEQGESPAGAERGEDESGGKKRQSRSRSRSASAGARSRSASRAGGSDDTVAVLADRAGADPDALRALAATLKAAGSVVIIWGERLSHGPRGKQAIDALLAVASALDVAGTDGSGLLEVPAGTNGRGLRELGVVPNAGPGFAAVTAGRDATAIADALASGESSALVLLHADPLATHPNRRKWEDALDRATFVVAFSEFLDGGLAEHADVVLPAESYAEREGTVVHPDGRLQRVRQTVGHAGEVRPVWWQLEQILERVGHGSGAYSAPMVSEQLFKAVPFYDGLTLEEIGGRGVRWQEREAASKLDAPEIPDRQLADPPAAPDGLRLGARPSLWTGYVTRHAPVLEFLRPSQTVELSPDDAERLGVGSGEFVQVGVNGTRVRATATVRATMPQGSAFLIEGTDDNPANALLDGEPQTVEVSPA